ncbi:hypothetical protein E2C01_004107 [Portunus trituberculatus]|uniref:Uncharacterized protein n=1 Tax=Portunus trituberculatus TaxID=210409 RepID=A0A5B7CPM5_PORTR|nr:hypothetical protein [Portunus trituberculatus]
MSLHPCVGDVCLSARPSPPCCAVRCRMACQDLHFFGSSTFYNMHDESRVAYSPLTHNANLAMHPAGYPGTGVLAPPPPTSPTSSPTRPVQGSHSAQASPTNTLKAVRPRARSADESVSGKKNNLTS